MAPTQVSVPATRRVAVFTGVIIVTAIPGWFELSKKSLGEEVKASQKTEHVGEGYEKSKFDPDLIKGRNTFAEIVEQTGIPRLAFKEKFKVSEEAWEKPIKDSTAAGGFTMGDVRNFVAQKLGIAGYTSTEK